jgi:hypothetical protein
MHEDASILMGKGEGEYGKGKDWEEGGYMVAGRV